MSEEKPRKSRAAFWVYTILALVLAYVLASGPTSALAVKYRASGTTLNLWMKCYAPLIRLTHLTGTNPWLGDYCHWWEDLFVRFDPNFGPLDS